MWLVIKYENKSWNHRLKWLRLEVTFGNCLVQPPAQSRVNYSRLLRAASHQDLNNLEGPHILSEQSVSVLSHSLSEEIDKIPLRLCFSR